MNQKIIKVNEILQKGEPDNWSTDHKGYAGYKPQAVIDAVNQAEIDWNLELLETYERDSGKTNKSGQKIVDILTKVRVTIDGLFKDAVASHPIIDDYGDAMKSAQTDAMKKALSHFSIGSRAYHGLLVGGKKQSTGKTVAGRSDDDTEDALSDIKTNDEI